MPRTPDSFPGVKEDEGLKLFDDGYGLPGSEGEIRYSDGYFYARDAYGIFNFHSESGISAEKHKILRHLIHFIDEGPGDGFASGASKQILPAGNPFPTQVIWKDASDKNLVVKDITRNPKRLPITIEWKIYDTDGSTILATVTDSITYSGVFEVSRTRSIS